MPCISDNPLIINYKPHKAKFAGSILPQFLNVSSAIDTLPLDDITDGVWHKQFAFDIDEARFSDTSPLNVYALNYSITSYLALDFLLLLPFENGHIMLAFNLI